LILTLLLFCLLLLEATDPLEVAEPDDPVELEVPEPDEVAVDEPDEPEASDPEAEESADPSLDPLLDFLLSDEQVDFELSHLGLESFESSSSSSEFKVSSSLSSLSSSFLVLGFVLFLLD